MELLTRYAKANILALVFATLPSIGAADVSETDALKWIQRGLLTLDCGSPAEDPFDRTIRHSADTIKRAWEFLKVCRDDGLAVGPEVTAAEHYLFARYAASQTGDTFYRILPSWYNSFKAFAIWADLDEYLQTSDQPVSPADPAVVTWGEYGVDDGFADYKARTGNEASIKTNALRTAFQFLDGSFY